ncbi:hypothetical protein MOQ72_11390 [Saccharopolyspora sp. K220]|uniref:hypothetical protein n=1 Tax=Saccharopolyspora soli TaxID=2926618 RepID=UPI001F58EE82|nr:hypothetical protein [Saccharopolyspora soli]MCI2418029.1 hypothetical protein [Saccharopolyspora soli]
MAELPTSQGIPVSDLPWRLGRRWIRSRRLAKIPDQPIVHLLRDNDANALINQLSDHLGTVVPKVTLDIGGAPDSSQQKQSVQIRNLLDKAAQRLREADSSPRIGRLRFRRYALLSWLLSKNVPPTSLVHGPNANTRQLLREYLSSRRPKRDKQSELKSGAWASAAQQLPWYLFVLSQVFFPLYYAWWVHRGRVTRWFMRQQYLTPRESADFPSFAQRLITTPSRRENAEQVRKLLVHAFLSDLADVYTRRLWRWRWVPKDCYPVLLLRNLEPDTIGETLVRLFNDVRNETGAPDPLVVIGAGTRTLPDAQSASESGTLDKWQQALQEARRKRSPTAWYVPLPVAEESSSEDEPNTLGRTELPLKHSKLLRRIPALALVLLLVAGTGAYLKQYFGPCGQLLPWQGLGLWAEGTECVGISDGSFQFSANILAENAAELTFRNELVGLQKTIQRQNRNAADEHELNREKPYVTIVYFSTLTVPDRNSSTLNGVLEELRGLAHAQNSAQLDGGVLIRIVLANGGAGMAHGPDVAESIAALAERSADSEAPVVGVVGLGGSWTSTRESIERLGQAGLPMVGTTTSADEFKNVSLLYHQVGPDNRRQAQVVAQYVRAHYGLAMNVKIYYTSNDLYSENLAHDLGEELRLPPDRMDDRNPPVRDEIPCGQQQLLFFAGRADQLGRFVESVTQRCRSLGQDVPHLMAGDDITKFMLDRTLPIGVTLEYTSFYGTIVRDEGLTGRAMLANDTVEVLQEAVLNVTDGRVAAEGRNPVPLNGLSVWRGIAEINGAGRVPGTTGIIDFGPESGQVPVDKAISVLRMNGPNTDADVVWRCGNGLEPRGLGCTSPN